MNIIKSASSDFKNMDEDEKQTKKPYEIVDVVEKIVEFNKKKQQEKSLKVLTPNQMLSRLPILLVQLNAGNNSEKLKDEV